MSRTEQDGEDLLAFIEEGAHKVGKSVDIPSPEGRGQAGWVSLQQLKVQPEVFTMLEQLREHKLFKGKWKTGSQVAWSMIYLGLRSCYQFFEGDEWKGFKSNFMALHNALQLAEQEKKQETLILAARRLRASVTSYLNKNTAFGRYKAWNTLEHCIKTRDMVEDVKTFDQNMRNPSGPVLDSNLVFDNRVGEYWEKLYPVLAGDLDEDAADLIYNSLTQDYFDELDAVNSQQQPHEDA